MYFAFLQLTWNALQLSDLEHFNFSEGPVLYTVILYIFLLSLFLQIFYYLFSFSGVAFSKVAKNKAQDAAELPAVTVLISAYNEYENLKKLLPILFQQDYPEFEVMVVNDRSTDETADYLKAEKLHEPRLKTVTIETTPEHINNKKYALNLGIKTAKNDVLLLTDADCRPASNVWIKEMAKKFDEKTQLVLGYSPYQRKKGVLNVFIRYETLLTAIQYLSSAISGSPYMGVGRNLAYRKSFFMEMKGFKGHSKVTGGDDDLFVNQHATKKNTKVSIGAESIIRSVPKSSWKTYIHQKRRHLSVGKFYKPGDKIKLTFFTLSHLLMWITFVVLILVLKEPYVVLGGLIFKLAIQYLIISLSLKKLGDKFKLIWLPVLDFCFIFYYLFSGFTAFFSKNIKWS